MTIETYAFDADANRLINLLTNSSAYYKAETFFRELVSNASDALDRARYQAITDGGEIDDSDKRIEIEIDEKNKTLTVTDRGIGMTKSTLVNTLGMVKQRRVSLLEQYHAADYFGIGFFAVFLVSRMVTVTTRTSNTNPYKWESTGHGFTVTKADDFKLARGTQVTCHLKDEHLEYLRVSRLKELVLKYCQLTSYEVFVGVKKYDHVFIEKMSCPVPIWDRQPCDISPQEYNTFYNNISPDQLHFGVKHFHVEGCLEFRTILFIPNRAPDLFEPSVKRGRMKLYARRILVSDNCEELVPEYLSFLRGVVDSSDLPINVSSEALSGNKILRVIRKHVERRAIQMFGEIAEDSDKYESFYAEYGRFIKQGIHDHLQTRTALVDLLRLRSTRCSETELISLKDYKDRMLQNQDTIYYIIGKPEVVKYSKALTNLTEAGIEVLLMTDPIDEYMMMQLREYNGIKFQSVEVDPPQEPAIDPEHDGLVTAVKDVLVGKVSSVQLSDNIDQPCNITKGPYETLTMVLNPLHPLVKNLSAKVKKTSPSDKSVRASVLMLYDSGLMNSGLPVDDVQRARIVGVLHKMMSMHLDGNCDDDDDFIFVETPVPEDDTTVDQYALTLPPC